MVLQSTQTSLSELPQLGQQLQACKDVACATAVSGRIQVETANLNAQSLQLTAMANAGQLQQSTSQMQFQQKMRADSAAVANGTSGTASGSSPTATVPDTLTANTQAPCSTRHLWRLMMCGLFLTTSLSAAISTQAFGQHARRQFLERSRRGWARFSVLGDTFSINPDAENTVTIERQPITPNGESSQTSQMAVVNDQVYGQDENTLQWFELVPGPGGDRLGRGGRWRHCRQAIRRLPRPQDGQQHSPAQHPPRPHRRRQCHRHPRSSPASRHHLPRCLLASQ